MSGHIKETLFSYVKDNTFKDTSKLNSETKLFVEGIFDSMGFALLIEYLEEEFGVETDDDDLVEENFESVSAIESFIQRKNPSLN